MARREAKPSRREENTRNAKRKAGVFTGLVIGVTIGIALAAGLVWYFNMWEHGYQSEAAPLHDEANTKAQPKPDAKPVTKVASKTESKPAAQPPQSIQAAIDPAPLPVRTAKPPPPKPAPQVKAETAPSTKPAPPAKKEFPYTFYGILPGDKPDRTLEPTVTKDSWWLQIAALSDANKAEQIRLRLKSLKLRASVQKIESNGQPLYRIRVGPYAQETDAFGDLDVLTDNELNARLLKDPVTPP